MTPDRWRRIEQLYHQVLERRESERYGFLHKACGGDEELRREVESLLRKEPETARFLEDLAIEKAVEGLIQDRQASSVPAEPWIGRMIGPYQVLSLEGAGGMGQVYRARDTKLKRDVAIKVLTDGFSRDPERLARFRREAQMLASLNHPNIAAIFGLEESQGIPVVVMEFVSGKTLAERLVAGPIPVDETLRISHQIAEALEAAHEKGIIHRDLKPANIKVTPDGKVKVLDFGLAKALTGDETSADLSKDLQTNLSEGLVLGTPAYMSPEQARGKLLDKRTDIWSFGCVIYEMLTGRSIFAGETVSDTIAAVLKSEPDWSVMPDDTPAVVQLLLRQCLNRDPQERLHDIADWRIISKDTQRQELKSLQQSKPLHALGLSGTALGAVFLMAIGFGVAYYARGPSTAPELRMDIATPRTPDPFGFAISPDGRTLVFQASSSEGKTQLWLRPLDRATAQPLAGTEGASFPFWNPNSREIGFFADGKLKRIQADGGPSQTIASVPEGRGGTWNSDGIILFTPNPREAIYRVSASQEGSAPVAVTRLDPPRVTSHRVPQFLPDGRHFLFYAQGASEAGGLYLASRDQSEPRRLVSAGTSATFCNGHLFFVRDGTLFAQPFDVRGLALAGEPFQVADHVGSVNGFGVSAAPNGTVVYRSAGGTEIRQLIWFDREGKRVGQAGDPDEELPLNLELSPDGKRVAFERSPGDGQASVWTMDIDEAPPSRFTFGNFRFPVWSPDGRQLVFSSAKTGVWRFYQKLTSGAGEEELLPDLMHQLGLATDWSPPDGRFLLISSSGNRNTGYDIWAVPMKAGEKAFALVQDMRDQRDAQFSPDGQWIAYQSNESGRFEIYVRAFPGLGFKKQISEIGGTQPRWRTARELFFIAADGKLMAAPVSSSGTDSALKVGPLLGLFPTHLVGEEIVNRPQVNRQQYDVSPDGQRFLMNVKVEEPTTPPITVITNWRAGKP